MFDQPDRVYTPDCRWIEYDHVPPASTLEDLYKPAVLICTQGRLTAGEVRTMSAAEFSKLRQAVGLPIARPGLRLASHLPVMPMDLVMTRDEAFRAWQSARSAFASGGSPQSLQSVIDCVRVDEDRYDYYTGRNY